MKSPRNRCGFLMLVKLRQSEWAQGFVLLMYNLLELLGQVMEFLLPTGGAMGGNGLRLLPVRARHPLMQMRRGQRRGASWDSSRTERTLSLNSARSASPWSPFSE